MNEQTKHMMEKTIGPLTVEVPTPKRTHTVMQEQLRRLDDLRFEIKRMEIAATEAQDEIIRCLDGVSNPSLEPGEFAFVKTPNFKRAGVDWKREVIDNLGQDYADEIQAKAKAEKKEISSYSIQVSKIGGAA